MKKAAKIIVFTVIGLFVAVGVLLSYVTFALPDTGPAPDLKVEVTPQRVERGRYLANHVTVCIDCHSPRDWSKFSGPYDTSRTGAGGEKFDHNSGLPGKIYSPNITPANLKDWTDGELYRAITTGVKKDGSAIFPIMPYKSYGRMDNEDIYSLIAYLRTLPAQAVETHQRKLDFPLNFIVNTIPSKGEPGHLPSKSDVLAYGAYLVNASACKDCHTQVENGEFVEGMDFGGGRDFGLPGGTVNSANITPDVETGIGSWTKEEFVSHFKAYADSSYQPPHVGSQEFQTVMPWLMYAGMEKGDLEAIYTYLKTLKPIKNKVTKFIPAGQKSAAAMN